FDHVTKTVTVVAMARVGHGDLKSCYEDACRRVDQLVEQLSTAAKPDAGTSRGALLPVDIDTIGEPTLSYQSNFTQTEFEEAVKKCVEYIRAGDIFQVVISQRLQAEVTAPPFEIYRT